MVQWITSEIIQAGMRVIQGEFMFKLDVLPEINMLNYLEVGQKHFLVYDLTFVARMRLSCAFAFHAQISVIFFMALRLRTVRLNLRKPRFATQGLIIHELLNVCNYGNCVYPLFAVSRSL